MANYTLLFSPTGNTEQVAKILMPHNEVINLLKVPQSRAFTENDTVLAAVPCYCGRVPAPAVERLQLFAGNGARAILLCTYGNRQYDDALSELQDTMNACGFKVVAAMAVVCEHSIYRRLGQGRPDDADMEDLRYFAKAIETASEPLSPLPGSHGTYHDFTLEAYDPAAKKEDCVKCGVYAEECPVGAINPKAPRYLPNANCIGCMRCVKVCPIQVRKIAPIAAARIVSFLAPYVNDRKPNELFIEGLSTESWN